jgi:hypothetical protein
MSTLESLCNELFIDLFEYFNVVDLLPSFADLNDRFNSLLFDYCRTFRADFRSILRKDFDPFNEKYFRSIKSQIFYLRLSNAPKTPDQCTRLWCDYFTIGQFENLRSLTLHKLGSELLLTSDFFVDFHCLRRLTHLKFVDCSFYDLKDTDLQGLIDQIWTLPRLTHFYWDCHFLWRPLFRLPKCVSTSLQCLTINHQYWSSNRFAPLFATTPRLRKFSVALMPYEEDDLPVWEKFVPSSTHLPLTKVFLFWVNSGRLLTNLFHLLPNVNHLKIEATNPILFDGHQWEQLLVKSFPQLKVFQLKMYLTFPRDENYPEKFNRYFNTYRSSFWIDRRWFIRCHWGFSGEDLEICLYSLPYSFNDCPFPEYLSNMETKSTCPTDLCFSYDSVREFTYEPWMSDNEFMSRVQFMNIEQLFVKLPFDSQFLSVFPTFFNLRSLIINKLPPDSELQLQQILDCAPRLEEIDFFSWTTMAMPPYSLQNSSLYRLNLDGYDHLVKRHCYTTEECLAFVESPLGRRCRVLTIRVKELECILILTSMMLNLRTLYLRDERDHQRHDPNVIEILRNCVSSKWNVNRPFAGELIIQS